MTTKPDTYTRITEQVLKLIERGTVPWRKPWKAGSAPSSISTNKLYRGINSFVLSCTAEVCGYESPYWGTYKKISELGGQVRKGEKGTLITFWKRLQVDDDRHPGKKKTIPLLRGYTVFNASQADGLPDKFYPVFPEVTPSEAAAEAERILASYLDGGPAFTHGGDRAYYSPAADLINLPTRASFDADDEYFSTAFHEATHSTGHVSRLAREGITEAHYFGDNSYANEELVAEFGATFLCGFAGIDNAAAAENSAAYLRAWASKLRAEPKLLVQAAGKAQRAVDLIRGVTWDNGETPVEVESEPAAVPVAA